MRARRMHQRKTRVRTMRTPGDNDEVDVNDASLAYAKALQKEMDSLPVWGVYESENSSRSSRTSSDRSARRSKRRRTT